jgi:carboxyl-terminal processing protease
MVRINMSFVKKPLLALTVFAIALAIWAGCRTSTNQAFTLPDLPPTSIQPGPNDPRIAYVAARLLEEYHYSQQPLDEKLSERFFDNYINSLDPRHANFLQSDLAEFNVYRTNLDKLTVGGHGTADLTPAFAIYDRYAERFQQHCAYVNYLLAQDDFKFNTDEKIAIDRRQAPFPKSLDEAKALWDQQLRYEYLQEKLSREITETNDNFVVKKLPANAARDIAATLARHYRWNLHMTTNWDSDNVLQVYLNALAHAYDPHSDYFSAPHAQDFSIGMNLSLFGIGAQLYEDDGYCTIRSVVPGGPAAKSKQVAEKDRIIAVAQGNQPPVDVVDMDLEKVVQMIRGAKGTEVRLTISPASDRSARKVVKLVRDEIKLEDSEAKAKLVEIPDGHGGTNRIGIIDLPSFYATVNLASGGRTTPKYTSVDVAKLVKRLKEEKVQGIIIDLRTNPGGSLEEAIKFTGLFIKNGPVVLARNPDGQVQVDSDPDPSQLYDGPLVVMVNRFSASASEIAAAALQDYGRALIVGDKSTHGKGTVQNLNPLKPFVWPATPDATNDPGMLKITIRKFYRINGESTQLRGVVPDIVLPDVLNHSTRVGEVSLDYPLPWDTISPVKYDKYNLVAPYLAQLRKDSEERVATNQDFRYVKQDIAQFEKSQAEKSATINEHDAIKDREQAFDRNKAREADWASRKPDGVKVYEIIVQNADKPGLVEYKPDETADSITATSGHDATMTGTIDAGATNGTQTNLVIQTTTTGTGTTNAVADAEAAKQPTPPDPMLDETERILLDYISLLAKSGMLVVHE